MLKFHVTTLSETEHIKANANANYVPKERCVGTICTDTETDARHLFSSGVKQNKYPKGACLVFVGEV